MASERIPSPESPVHEGSTTQQLHMGGEGESRSFSGASERKRNMPRAGTGSPGVPKAASPAAADPVAAGSWNSADPSTGTTGLVGHMRMLPSYPKSLCMLHSTHSVQKKVAVRFKFYLKTTVVVCCCRRS